MTTSRLHVLPHPSSVSSFHPTHPSTRTLPLAVAPTAPALLISRQDEAYTHHHSGGDLSTTEDASTTYQVRKSKYYGTSSEVSQLVRQGRQRIREQRQELREKQLWSLNHD